MNFIGISILAFAGYALLAGGEIRGSVCLKETESSDCVKAVDSVRICCFVPGETDSIVVWTDSLGKFRILIDEPPGRKTLILSKVGFVTTQLQGIMVSENKTTYVTGIQLERSK